MKTIDVKCDQKRPACRTCRALGVPCEGFSDQVLWMRNNDDDDPDDGNSRRGTRRHLYSGSTSLIHCLPPRKVHPS
jgi:arginine metabolism regulation protein II